MRTKTVYTPLSRSRLSPPEEAPFFMMNALLYSRLEAGYPTNREFFDEDVNVYLAGLLCGRVYAGRPASDAAALARFDAALHEAAAGADRRRRFDLYRSCADEILFSLGVFRNARGARPSGSPLGGFPDRFWIGRGEAYYAIARSCGASLRGGAAGLVEVMGKLSRAFERYAAVLSHLGGEHLGIVRGISDGELFHLARPAEATDARDGARARGAGAPRDGAPSRETVAAAYDRFLDCYSACRRDPSSRARSALEASARELRALDPSFSFDAGTTGPFRSL